MVDAGRFHFPWLPVNWLLRDRYLSVDRIPLVTCPVLHYHGDQDEIVPHSLGQKLFAAVPDVSSNGVPKRFVTLQHTAHNDVLHVAADQVEEAIREFLRDVKTASAASPQP